MARPKKTELKREIDVRIGERLKTVRKHLFKATQAEFAEVYNVSEQTVRMWEKGVYSVPDDVLRNIANKAGIDFDFLKCKYDDPILSDHIKKWNGNAKKIINEYHSQQLLFEYCDSIGYSFSEVLEELGLTGTNENGENPPETEQIINDFVHSINTFIIAKETELKKGEPTMSESVKAYLNTVTAWEIKLPILHVYEDYNGFCKDNGFTPETIGVFAEQIK